MAPLTGRMDVVTDRAQEQCEDIKKCVYFMKVLSKCQQNVSKAMPIKRAMEKVHRPELKPWICSDKLSLKSYFDNYAETIKETDLGHKRYGKRVKMKRVLLSIMKLDVDDDAFNAVEDACKLSHFDLPHELGPVANNLPVDNLEEFVEDNAVKFRFQPIHQQVMIEQQQESEEGVVALKTLLHQARFLSNCSVGEQSRRVCQLRRHNDAYFDHSPSSTPLSFLCNQRAMLVVRVYKGCEANSSAINALRYQQEFFVLATNTLSELRDRIKCRNDLFVPTDVSEAPNKIRKVKRSSAIYTSSFMFIENCFFNDTRSSHSIDYSRVINDWVHSNADRGIGPFTSRAMQYVTFEDLDTIMLGYPYLYVHQGDCEHLMTINQVRLVSADDPQTMALFPFERSVSMVYDKLCMICGSDPAKWVVTQHQQLPEDPFLFCDECFKIYNYDAQGYKVDEFKAYAYVNANDI